MRVPFALTIILFMLGLCVYLARNPEPVAAAAGPTNGERWRAMCAIEAGRSKRDQDDCYSKHALGAAFERNNADFDRRMRAVR